MMNCYDSTTTSANVLDSEDCLMSSVDRYSSNGTRVYFLNGRTYAVEIW